MADIKFKDFSVEVKDALSSLAYRAVEESCGELESQTKRNTVVDTGQTKNGWIHNVVDGGEVVKGYVSNPLPNY